MIKDNTLTISYRGGRGHMTFNLYSLPLTATNIRRFRDYLDIADGDRQALYRDVYGWIKRRVNELKKDADRNAQEIKGLISNANALRVSGYGRDLPVTGDAAETIRMHGATVYARHMTRDGVTVKCVTGWTFEKGGYTFDVYQSRKAARNCTSEYTVLLHGTGLVVLHNRNRIAAAQDITPETLDYIRTHTEKIENARRELETMMIDAGMIDIDESIDNAAETVETSEPVKEPEPEHVAADAAETVETVAHDDAKADDAETAHKDAKTDAKNAHGPVPPKTFAGTQINGNGWKILFDDKTGRTRVILTDGAPAIMQKFVTAAGFWYSPNQKSYNKKLSWKAYRAALKLAEQLKDAAA